MVMVLMKTKLTIIIIENYDGIGCDDNYVYELK